MAGKPRGRPFQPGQSGNPSGRPKLRVNLTHLLVAELERPIRGSDVPQAEQMVHMVVQRALAGERWACELCWDRLEGKPAQHHTFDAEALAERLAAEHGVDKGRLLAFARRAAEQAG